MKKLILSLHFFTSILAASIAAADHHIDDLMSDGVDYDTTTVKSVTTNTISMPLVNKPNSNIKRPVRTDSKRKVISEFGGAIKHHPVKGNPPIERWDYADFSVYFESGYVIHSVVRNNEE